MTERPIELTPEQIERFWSHVDRSGQVDACHEWRSGCFVSGYGSFKAEGISYRAHRVAWTLAYGEIPEGLLVCHTCDNRKCVNPAHLFLGTSAQNVHDAMRKRRFPHGQTNGQSRLTEEQVQQIRALFANGNVRQVELAEQFGISHQSISEIVNGRRWTWLRRD